MNKILEKYYKIEEQFSFSEILTQTVSTICSVKEFAVFEKMLAVFAENYGAGEVQNYTTIYPCFVAGIHFPSAAPHILKTILFLQISVIDNKFSVFARRDLLHSFPEHIVSPAHEVEEDFLYVIKNIQTFFPEHQFMSYEEVCQPIEDYNIYNLIGATVFDALFYPLCVREYPLLGNPNFKI